MILASVGNITHFCCFGIMPCRRQNRLQFVQDTQNTAGHPGFVHILPGK